LNGRLALLAHAVEVRVEPTLVLAERRVARAVPLYPCAHVAAQLRVVRGRAVQLVGERAEEAVAVAERRRGVQPEPTQLLRQQLVVQRRVGFERLAGREVVSREPQSERGGGDGAWVSYRDWGACV
jgi:hypothetical protein